jgi:FkbM family methyltransferase
MKQKIQTDVLKNYIFFFFYLLTNIRLLKLLVHQIYIPVFIQFEWLKNYHIKTIIDVGAYHGEVSKSLHLLFPDADIFAFEPVEENLDIIYKKLDKKAKVIPMALSDKIEKKQFNVYSKKYLSSFLNMDAEYSRKLLPTGKPIKTNITVETTTLDSFFKKKQLKKHIILKIDTQGSEGVVLKGGKNLLKSVSIIHLEAPFDSFYAKQDYFANIYDFLIKQGFKYVGEARESNFYPLFKPQYSTNCLFINPKLIQLKY